MSRSSNVSPPHGQGRSNTMQGLQAGWGGGPSLPAGRTLPWRRSASRRRTLAIASASWRMRLASAAWCAVRAKSMTSASLASTRATSVRLKPSERSCTISPASSTGGAIGAPAGSGAHRHNQPALFIEPKRLGRHAQPFGRLGRIEKLGASAHESPRCVTTPLCGLPLGPGQGIARPCGGMHRPCACYRSKVAEAAVGSGGTRLLIRSRPSSCKWQRQRALLVVSGGLEILCQRWR